MANETRRHISELLLSNRKHAKYLGILACLAVVVVFGVAMGLRQNGRAATHEEQVLDCHYSGNGAHTHDESCYDKDGNLMCPLPERELHTHTDACYDVEEQLICDKEEYEGHIHTDDCYDEEGNLICGLEEHEGHKHTDDCYDEDGELICGQEEREVHTHTDACYETVKTLICDKEEVTEEHVHGPGCFKTITVPDEEEAEAEDQYPEQEFEESLTRKDSEGKEHVVLTVAVKAPEGALPEGTTMRVSGIANDEVDDLEAKVDAAVKRSNGENVQVKQWQAVDIKFFDKGGNEIEPKKDVEVKITSSKVSEIESPVLVHVIDKDKDSAKGKDVDAEVLDKVSIVNQDDDDTSEGNEDTLKFKSGEFSPYVIVELEELYAEYLSSNGATYDIKVTADGDAQIPADAKLSVTELSESSRAYLNAYYTVVQNKLYEDPTFDESQFGMAAVDISILDGNGNIFEPYAPVTVNISMKLPADVDNEVLQNTLEVQHLDTSTGETVVQTVADVSDGVKVGKSTATAEFVVDGFSTFVISWTGNSEEPETPVTDPQAKATLNIQENGTTYATVTVHYVDVNGNNLTSPLTSSVNSGNPATIGELLNGEIEGYSYVGAKYFANAAYSADGGETVNSITVSREERTESAGTSYDLVGKTNGNAVIPGYTPDPNAEYYTSSNNNRQRVYWNYNSSNKFQTHSSWGWGSGYSNYTNQNVYIKTEGTRTTYTYTLTFDNDNIEALTSTALTGAWNNATDIYLVYESEDTSLKEATIHFGTLNNDGSFTELQQSVSFDITADAISLNKAIAGYVYVGAYYCKGETTTPSANSVEISPTLKKENDIWYFTNASTTQTGHLVNGSHIYASYMEDTSSSTSTPEDNNNIPTPSTIKNVEGNGDGTYDIQLDIIGKEIVKEERKGANVLIIFDRTSSMESNKMGAITRLAAAKSAVSTLVDALDPSKNPVEIAMFTFDRAANSPYQPEGDSYWTTDGDEIKTYTNGIKAAASGATTGSGGTNWEAAFVKAKEVLEDSSTDSDPTYVIFLTDGNPTFYNGATAIENATENTPHYTRARTAAHNLDTKYKIYNILCANQNDGPLLNTLTTYLNDNGHIATHVLANDETTLKNTFKDIAEYIVNQLAASSVATNDGITKLSTVNASVSGAAGAFKYYKAYEVKQENNKYYYYTYNDDGEVEAHEVQANQVETYSYQDKDGNPKSYLYYNRQKWNGAPGASYSADSGVTWDLGSEGALSGGQIYSVRFTIWPSQAAYDLLADLNNGKKVYAAGHENSITEAERKQVYESGGVYYLKTNTTLDTGYEFAGNSYSDTIPYHQGAMNLDSEKIGLQKLWPKNLLDDYKEGQSQTGIQDNIVLTITRDGVEYLEVPLDKNNKWLKEDVYISCGVMTIHDDKVDIKETGHDYTVIEPVSFSYYWDLIADVYHPMVINGTTTLLVLDKTATTADNVNSFKINGKIYKKQTNSTNTLEASNFRRSNLNLTKSVDGINAPDTYFTFKVKVTEASGDNVWFSVWDPVANGVVISDEIVTGADREQKDDGTYTGYYYAASGSEVTIKIKAGWNVRFLNLLHDSTFTFEETGLSDGFSFKEIETWTKYDMKPTSPAWFTTSGTVISGSIVEPNNQYSVQFDNKWSTIDVQLKKVDEATSTRLLNGSVFKLAYRNAEDTSWVQVSGDLNEIKPGYVDTENHDNDVPNPVNLGGIGVGRYKLTEIKAPDGYVILDSDVYFQVYKEDGEYKVRLTNETGTPTGNNEKVSVTSSTVNGNPSYMITIGNSAGSSLPRTGGPGTAPYTIFGTAIVVLAILTYGLTSRHTSGRRSMQ